MTLHIIDTDDAAWRERAKTILDEAADERWSVTETLNTLIATMQPVDEAAVERAAEAVDEAAYFVIEYGQDPELKNTEDCVRAALNAAAKRG